VKTRLQIVVVAALLVPTVHAETYFHPSWDSRAKAQWILAVFPATYETELHGIAGRSLHREESEVIEGQLAAYAIGALEARGWTIADDSFRRQDIAQNRELLYLVGYLRERHATLAQRVMRTPKEMKAGRVSFGKPITELKPFTKANILVFVHVEGLRSTAAARILGLVGDSAVLLWGSPPARIVALNQLSAEIFSGPKVTIHMSFVDAESGDILCFIRPNSTGERAFLKELDKLQR